MKSRSKKITYEVYYESHLSGLYDFAVILLPYCVLEMVSGDFLARREIFSEEEYT
jgi:hypothetical protein